MKRFLKTSAAVAALLASFQPAGADEPKWYDTADRFVVRGVRNLDDGYGDFLTIYIEGPDNHIYMAYNLDVIAPAGVTFPVTSVESTGLYEIGDVFYNNDDGFYPTTISGRPPVTTYNHSLQNAIHDFGTRARIICLSFRNDEFLKPTGAIADCFIKVHPLAKAGENRVRLKGMVFNTKNPETGYPIQWAPFNTLKNEDWSTITIPAERTVEINIPAAQPWAPLILPFALSSLPEGVTAYTAVEVNDDAELLLEPAGSIEPYKPYIVNAPDGWIETLNGVASADDFPEETAPESRAFTDPYPLDAIATNGVLRSNITPHERSEGYVFSADGATPSFSLVTSDSPAVLSTGNVYLPTPSNLDHLNLPQTISVKVKGSATSITEISTPAAPAPIYNLQGVRITAPRPGQIYLTRGHLFRK